jgi:hypothetical protein
MDDFDRYVDRGRRCSGCGDCACLAASSSDAGRTLEADVVVVVVVVSLDDDDDDDDAELPELFPTPNTFHKEDGFW